MTTKNILQISMDKSNGGKALSGKCVFCSWCTRKTMHSSLEGNIFYIFLKNYIKYILLFQFFDLFCFTLEVNWIKMIGIQYKHLCQLMHFNGRSLLTTALLKKIKLFSPSATCCKGDRASLMCMLLYKLFLRKSQLIVKRLLHLFLY